MAGLNDEYFITDDSMEKPVNPVVTIDAFKDNQEGEDTPELRDDIDLIAAATEELCIVLRSTELVRERIAGEGGMSQSIALEALGVMPGLITDLQPAGFYTKYPSKTMLKVAMEEAAAVDQDALKKFIAFITHMFERIMAWLKSFLTSDPVLKLATPENTALLKNAPQTFTEAEKLSLGMDKVVDEVSEEVVKKFEVKMLEYNKEPDPAQQAADKAKELEGKRAEYQASKFAEKLKQLQQDIPKIRADTLGGNAFSNEINSMLAKTPHVKRILGNPSDVSEVLFTHDNTVNELNGFVGEVQKCIDKQDYAGLKAIIDDGKFVALREKAEKYAIAVVEFKALEPNYTVERFSDFLKVIRTNEFLKKTTFAAGVTEGGVAQCQATEKGMEAIQKSIEQMASYKWSDREGQAREFMEELRNFNKSVIVPTIQRISFTFDVTSQLVKLVNSISTMNENISAIIRKKLQERILARAKELGIPDEEARKYI